MLITPWTKRKIRENGITEVDESVWKWLFGKWESGEETPIKLFFIVDGDTVVAVDNMRDSFWTEEFTSVSRAVKWLCREIEVTQ